MPRLEHNDATAGTGRRKKVKLFGYMIGTAVFFAVTLLISFFLLIITINAMKVPANMASNILMLGLVPPSVATFLLFTKMFGRVL
ncbi:MAG: hypothetical protein M3298_06875 [Thermoproteota archaeon]|nr:hypothetical protein [Thermoproteota archaeon]